VTDRPVTIIESGRTTKQGRKTDRRVIYLDFDENGGVRMRIIDRAERAG
jgi:hypothetical protein